MLNTEQKAEIIKRRAMGESIRSIAGAMRLSNQTIVDYCKEARERIAAAKAVELDALLESEQLSISERIKTHSSLMRKLRQEIEQRDLGDVPTEKLIDLYLKAEDKLSEIVVEPNLLSEEEIAEEEQDRQAIEVLSDAG